MLGDLTYEYDKNGNRTKIGGSFARTGIPQSISSTAYNVANHQTTFGDKTLTYDNNGNLQTVTEPSGTTTYTWNARTQLVGINVPTVTASFVYDGLGRRQQKPINGNSTEFLYDGVNPVQESSGAALLANILPGLGIDEFLTRTDVVAGTTSNFLTDALGSPIAVTDATGTVQTEYTFEPFGNTTVTGASNTTPYQYTGRENDGTGLYYYRARYYSPQLQRFISEDPIEFYGGDVNLYAYVGNSSLNYVDPYGLDKNPGLEPSPPWGPPLGPDTPPPAGPLPPDCPLGPDCYGGNRNPPNRNPPPPPVPGDLNGDGKFDEDDWSIYFAVRQLWRSITPPGPVIYPPGFGNNGPGSTDPPLCCQNPTA